MRNAKSVNKQRSNLKDTDSVVSRSAKKNSGVAEWGPEPIWDRAFLDDSSLQLAVGIALGWYNAMTDFSGQKRFVLAYAKPELHKSLDPLPDYEFNVIGSLARMKMRDAPLLKKWITKLDTRIKELVVIGEKLRNRRDDPKTIVKKVTAADRVLLALMSETSSRIDEILTNKRKQIDQNLADFLFSKGATATQVDRVRADLETTINEITALVDGTADKDLIESYSTFPKASLKRFHEFLTANPTTKPKVVQISQKPRKKRAVKPSQIVKKIKFKQSDKEFGLVSIDPTDLVGASQLWIFNCKSRQLGCYFAASEEGLSLKGTTIQNFDAEKSISKNIRKPKEYVPPVVKMGKVELRKVLSVVRAAEKGLTGRLNDDTILVRVVK